MFALMNPPIKKSKKTALNSWFGEPKRHARAAKKGWHQRRGKRSKKLFGSTIFTPGGGIIRRTAGRPIRPNSFMGINPLNSKGAFHMAKRKRGSRRSRFNFGFSQPKQRGITDFLKPKNYIGVIPILVGVIADGIVTKYIGDKSRYTRSGLGSIALGIVGAGGIGLLGSVANRQLGEGLFVGGMVGTLGCAFQNFMQGGFHKAFGLGDDLSDFPTQWYGNTGIGNFVTPGAVANAIPSGSTMSQYSLPNTNAQFLPGAQMQAPQTPAQAMMAQPMAHEEGQAIGAMMSGQEDISGYAV